MQYIIILKKQKNADFFILKFPLCRSEEKEKKAQKALLFRIFLNTVKKTAPETPGRIFLFI
jgi:hypothetical protein